MELTDFGRVFHNFAAFTEKEFSYMVLIAIGQFLAIGGTLARIPCRSDWLKDILMSFGILPLRIFHALMMIYLSLLLWREGSWRKSSLSQ